MLRRFLNLSCTGRDVVLSSQREDDAQVRVFAYRVFDTDVGFGVAGQTVDRDKVTEVVTQVDAPYQLRDGFASLAEAIQWMRQRANETLPDLIDSYQVQGEVVYVVKVEDGNAVE